MGRPSKLFSTNSPNSYSALLKDLESFPKLPVGAANANLSTKSTIWQHAFKAHEEYSIAANDKLEEWIDGNVIHSFTGYDVNIGIAEAYFQACLLVLRQTWLLILQKPAVLYPRQRKIYKEVLGRFVLWIDSFKAGELDQILVVSEDLKENVFDLLTEIARSLIHSMLRYSKQILS